MSCTQGSKKLAWKIGFPIFLFFQVFTGFWPFQGSGPLGIACPDPFPSERIHPQPGEVESDLFLAPRNLVGPTSSRAIFSEPAVGCLTERARSEVAVAIFSVTGRAVDDLHAVVFWLGLGFYGSEEDVVFTVGFSVSMHSTKVELAGKHGDPRKVK